MKEANFKQEMGHWYILPKHSFDDVYELIKLFRVIMITLWNCLDDLGLYERNWDSSVSVQEPRTNFNPQMNFNWSVKRWDWNIPSDVDHSGKKTTNKTKQTKTQTNVCHMNNSKFHSLGVAQCSVLKHCSCLMMCEQGQS